eukprot:GHVR01108916.1.p2 GENE.GHVR01108916.1~~GHVR01108916.1.p2  ORF type:complete len:122 (+),score=19.83 GHVR01108916.1:720-1085(+)
MQLITVRLLLMIIIQIWIYGLMILYLVVAPLVAFVLVSPTRRSSPVYCFMKLLNFSNCLLMPRIHPPSKIEESMLAYTQPIEMSPYIERREWWLQAQQLPARLEPKYTQTHTHEYSHTNIP